MHLSVSTPVCQWIHNFLSNRKQLVSDHITKTSNPLSPLLQSPTPVTVHPVAAHVIKLLKGTDDIAVALSQLQMKPQAEMISEGWRHGLSWSWAS